MKKTLLLVGVAVLALSVSPALAERNGEGKKGQMFEKHDTNGDGQVSQEEFLENAKLKFAEKDANGDGFITKEEGKAAHEAKREKRKGRKGSRGLNQ